MIKDIGNSISHFDSILTSVSLLDFVLFPKSVLNPVLVHFEVKSLIFYDHTSLMRKVGEHQFFDLDSIFESISTLTFESRFDLS